MPGSEDVVKWLFVFDLDGPLMKTGELYDGALAVLAELVFKEFGGKIFKREILRRQNELDRKMLQEINPRTGEKYLYNKSRFPLSLVRTYEVLCLENGKKCSVEISRQLREAGRRVFDKAEYMRIIRREVLPLFRFLHKMGCLVVILTKGSDQVQLDKKHTLKKAGIMRYVKEFIVVSDDKGGKLKEIREKYAALRYYCIGDTYLEDVLPGMEIGYFGIHIPYKLNWKERGKSGKIEAMRDKKRSVKFKSIAEIQKKFHWLKGA